MWDTRDELVRTSKVSHLQRRVLYKSSVYASKVLCVILGTSYEVPEWRLVVLMGSTPATQLGTDYTPVILSRMHGSERPVSPTFGPLPFIEASWTGILLARQLAIIDRNRWLFSPEKEFIQAVEGYLRREKV